MPPFIFVLCEIFCVLKFYVITALNSIHFAAAMPKTFSYLSMYNYYNNFHTFYSQKEDKYSCA